MYVKNASSGTVTSSASSTGSKSKKAINPAPSPQLPSFLNFNQISQACSRSGVCCLVQWHQLQAAHTWTKPLVLGSGHVCHESPWIWFRPLHCTAQLSNSEMRHLVQWDQLQTTQINAEQRVNHTFELLFKGALSGTYTSAASSIECKPEKGVNHTFQSSYQECIVWHVDISCKQHRMTVKSEAASQEQPRRSLPQLELMGLCGSETHCLVQWHELQATQAKEKRNV